MFSKLLTEQKMHMLTSTAKKINNGGTGGSSSSTKKYRLYLDNGETWDK